MKKPSKSKKIEEEKVHWPYVPFMVMLVEEPDCKHELVINETYKVVDTFTFCGKLYLEVEIMIRGQPRNVLYHESRFELVSSKAA